MRRKAVSQGVNGIPFDPQKPALTSGIRLGTSAGTTRGFREEEFREIGALILRTLRALVSGDSSAESAPVIERVRDLCRSYPIYPESSRWFNRRGS
ncbi:hypothetical protein [Bradyrhizobium lablabi]|nr:MULTISPECIES: hypothetical protein [Bradyrhizobium]